MTAIRTGSYNVHIMKVVGARELKNRLGTYLRQVREGVTIIVTDRGRPVAELRPLQLETEEESPLLELAALGLLTPRSRKTLTARSPAIRVTGKAVSETILEDREDRF
ncbi:MAG: type II toxin-antitoxin system Phd/YefM family antitoxin [Acidobacteriota bacterium]